MTANEKVNIVLLSTGGTIEKTYDESDGVLENRKSIINEKIVNKLRLPYTNLTIDVLMAKDSLHMDDNDRIAISEAVKRYNDLKMPIVVLHGTDTMHLSAETCHDRLGKIDVPVVFTGAMRPLEFESSDAIQNVTEALLAAKISQPGIYVSFHSRLFCVPGVRKNKEKGTFERSP